MTQEEELLMLLPGCICTPDDCPAEDECAACASLDPEMPCLQDIWRLGT